ncbi:MAG: hypothetical protein HQL54_13305 [Magnetococcales bacterium]|nr:hypothetical protein [Magnetococcales bacterium]
MGTFSAGGDGFNGILVTAIMWKPSSRSIGRIDGYRLNSHKKKEAWKRKSDELVISHT